MPRGMKEESCKGVPISILHSEHTEGGSNLRNLLRDHGILLYF